MRLRGWMLGSVVLLALAGQALAFDAYFADAQGRWLGKVWEGQWVYVAVRDPDKGACGIAEFQADILIFDFKTGAYIERYGETFRELGGIGSGLFFWVTGPGSTSKVAVPIGSRKDFKDIPEGVTHVLQPAGVNLWQGGAWEYVDEGILLAGTTNSVYKENLPVLERAYDAYRFGIQDLPSGKPWDRLPWQRRAVRINLESEKRGVAGRLENMDTLVLIVRDLTNPMNIDQDQLKIIDTVAKITVTPSKVTYDCGTTCRNIVVRIEDRDENLDCNEVEYVPFFVIINPGSWNEDPTTARDFCTLMRHGGVTEAGDRIHEIIRWYNIYRISWKIDENPVSGGRHVDYRDAPWAKNLSRQILRAVFFAAETGPNTGIFELNFGNLLDFQEALGLSRGDRLLTGSTIAFYYIDPNDFDDMDLTTMEIGDLPHSQVLLTDAWGHTVEQVRIGWDGLYIRVLDADANINACCQDQVVVHLCDPHGEDDAEYIVIDEISNNSGIFFTQSGIPIAPVWDAVGGYQLVYDDWRVQVFNEDTIFARYNSVGYLKHHLDHLGDSEPNDYDAAAFFFPPMIDYDVLTATGAPRNQYWDVSFAKVKVYDTQVFDGTTHAMRFLDGNYQPILEIPVSGSLYLEVVDPDQNEAPQLRELIFGGWNKDSDTFDEFDSAYVPEDSAPIWGTGAYENGGSSSRGILADFLGLHERSISGAPETVKIFVFNAQRGTWERMDLRETGVSTGVFRSTTCVLVGDAKRPGEGNLGSSPGDTIMAFYQDPSNHSDVAIVSIKVGLGGAGAITPPPVTLVFDKSQYNPGETVTLILHDELYSGAEELSGPEKLLVLCDKEGQEIASWSRLSALPGQPGKFQVSYELPATVKLGKLVAKYTDPSIAGRSAQAMAMVVAKSLERVKDVVPQPRVFSTSTTFTVVTEPAGSVVGKISLTIYDLTGAKVATLTGLNTNSLTWNGGNLGNGAYIYVAVVEGAGQVWRFKGFVYIERQTCPVCR
ncbi:MAG: hypothetical protein QXY39_04475 [Thermofilaceae archaeon]